VAYFAVVINGEIKGITHRFSGGSGKAEIYETEDGREISILVGCPFAFEVDEPAPPEEPEPEPEAITDARGRLEAMSYKELAAVVKGRHVIKPGMDRSVLIEAVLAKPGLTAEILERRPEEDG
jgi:hypothetical protein